MRRAIVRAMTASAQIPQFTLGRDVHAGPLAAVREHLGDARSVSLTDQIVAAVARSLVEHPRLNASYVEDEVAIIEHSQINVGIAVAIRDGLVTPPILDANRLSLFDLAAARREATSAVRDRRIDAASLAKVTFTISNLGPFGVDRFTALVVPPQAAILAVGAVSDGRMCLSLSCDHRVVDGAPAAEFLRDVVAGLEEPEWMERLPGRVGMA
jgi:pyruvate dehydrogenase E2 component (dihydrolipoamide acetyltransferase)